MKVCLLSLLTLLMTPVVITLGAPSASAAVSVQDRDWMGTIRNTDLAEMNSGQSAQTHGASPRVRTLGANINAAHAQLDSSVRQASLRFGVNLPATPTLAQQQSLDLVEARRGTAYDAAWIATEISQHRQSLADTQRELDRGSEPAIVALARTAAEMLRQHLAELQGNAVVRPVTTTTTTTTSSRRTTTTTRATTTRAITSTTRAAPTRATTHHRTPTHVNAGTGGQAASATGPGSASYSLIGFGVLAVAAAAGGLRLRRLRA